MGSKIWGGHSQKATGISGIGRVFIRKQLFDALIVMHNFYGSYACVSDGVYMAMPQGSPSGFFGQAYSCFSTDGLLFTIQCSCNYSFFAL